MVLFLKSPGPLSGEPERTMRINGGSTGALHATPLLLRLAPRNGFAGDADRMGVELMRRYASDHPKSPFNLPGARPAYSRAEGDQTAA
jgi:hypothetical protein